MRAAEASGRNMSWEDPKVEESIFSFQVAGKDCFNAHLRVLQSLWRREHLLRITVYEDSHGAGTLENSDHYSFTANNEDLWLLPSDESPLPVIIT